LEGIDGWGAASTLGEPDCETGASGMESGGEHAAGVRRWVGLERRGEMDEWDEWDGDRTGIG
jgi:hypothetical protein